MRSAIILFIGFFLGIASVFVSGTLSSKIEKELIHFFNGKTMSEFKLATEYIKIDSQADLFNEILDGAGLDVQAFSLFNRKASEVDCRRGVISTLEQNNLKVTLKGQEIQFELKDTSKGNIKGIASCKVHDSDSLSDIFFSVAVSGKPDIFPSEKIQRDLILIWGAG